jgi:peptide deformylase
MAILQILNYPDPRLRTLAKPVTQVDEKIRKIVADMLETMYQAPGIGLAATQVNIHKQIIVIDASPEKDQPLCLINPTILTVEGSSCVEEGCLSVPGVYEPVERAAEITVQALDKQGESFSLFATDILAICIQHEMDHLKGKLFVDYLSLLKRERLRKKLIKQQKQAS